tara:strand:+ start:259 stop:1434 length:1176 start_codon:yes stop_codon:yes gene_type:complete
MGLSVFQSLAIAGGKAAETISAVEKERKSTLLASLSKSIDDAKVPAGAYRQKHMLIKSQAKDQLNRVIDTYVPSEIANELNLSRPQQVVLANALWKKHDYKYDNINKNYQSSLTMSKTLGSDKYNLKAYLKSQFGKDVLNSDIKGMTLDSAVNIIAQEKAGPSPLTTESFAATSDAYDSSSIFTNPIDPKDLALKAKQAFNLPDTVNDSIPTVEVAPTVDAFKIAQDVQKYAMNEGQMAKWKNDALRDGETSMADWQKLHKTAANNAISASKLKIKIVDEGGVLSYKMPGGEDQTAIKRIVEREILRNFVLGGMGSDRLTDKNFLAYVQNVGANVQGITLADAKGEAIPGMAYTDGVKRFIYTGIDTGNKNAKGAPIYYTIPLLSAQPEYK